MLWGALEKKNFLKRTFEYLNNGLKSNPVTAIDIVRKKLGMRPA